ncbi:methylamine utilization protein [Pseudomonas sp. S1Bt30]|uniref:Methylamine utilization protein n=1 Tax=Pseudomonas quebecensis TaxID=2995174 RepID=A0ABY6QD36_9PSED|nr:methylamine utilization protein [Pseudomonas quebecensis]MCX4066040.1 methylamine utilization protein [Pseudomonas quebecensis]UZW17448.1 methylamine utilization protein [Pseudomonas quebecensis]UZW25136.1 methylamine utilization protein [Pseudomonas quebecensis]UZW30199.1 methylamine utilization protein [Pseudomonas quebecensis]
MARCVHLLSHLLLLLAAAGPASAATLEVLMQQADGRPVADAVVTLQGPAGAAAVVSSAEMDQRSQRFAPHVLAVHTGTQVRFPNSDNIRHQVYSFSTAKRFELRLYEGTPTAPLLFDKPGVVVLGCNIHDWMLGYIYVTDDPHFGVSDAQGRVRLEQLTPGDYRATVWHPQLADLQPMDGGTLHIPAAGLSHRMLLTLEPASADLPPAPTAFGDAFNRAARETAQ